MTRLAREPRWGAVAYAREGDPRLAPASPSLAASLAREFVMEHGQVLTQLQLAIPVQAAHLREAYLPAFERTVGVLIGWLGAKA